MKNSDRVTAAQPSILLLAGLLLAPGSAVGQDSKADEAADAARAERLAERFERNARFVMLLDRDGNVLRTVGERGMHGVGVISPDGTRLAVPELDIYGDTFDIWVVDVATGKRIKLKTNAKTNEEWTAQPVWSPDGHEIAYVALRAGFEGIYRTAADGNGPEELLYRDDRADVVLGDWSMDGRFLSFSVSDGFFEGSLYVLPTQGPGEREPIEVFHDNAQLQAGSFSPDARLLSFVSDVTGRQETYVLELDPEQDGASRSADPIVHQISEDGSGNALRSAWRSDGSELYYIAADRGIMATSFDDYLASPQEATTLLFRPSQAIGVGPVRVSVSRDGERILLTVPHRPTLEQITVFNRSGDVVRELGEPGIYRNPAMSLDGTRVAAMRVDPDTNNRDIWSFDLDSGTGTAITDDDWEDNWPVWSPDGTLLAYGSERGLYSEIHIAAASGLAESRPVYRYTPGAFLEVTDWSPDGRFLTFQDGCWGVLHVVPLPAPQSSAAEAIEWLRDAFQVAQARFSPDGRFIAYLTDEAEPDSFELHVAPFDPALADATDNAPLAVNLAGHTVRGMVSWRHDGREIYFLSDDWEVMAVPVETSPAVRFGAPQRLFSLTGPLPGNPKQWTSVSADGERFVFVTQVPAPY